jgi:hypothetical protein
LRVKVNHQHALPQFGQASGQVDGGGGFANPTFLVSNAKYFGHDLLHSRNIKKTGEGFT